MKTVRSSLLLALIAWLAFVSLVDANDETLDRVKALYRSAEYEEALAVLDQLPKDSVSTSPMEAGEYRLLCLVALDRKTEARDAVVAMVNADPFYQLSQASPRVRTMFNDVRQSLLPAMVQRAYADAKAAFDREDPESTAQFERVLTLLNDPAIAAVSTLGDLRTVTTAFLDLSKARARRPEPPPVATAPAVPAGNAGKSPEPGPTIVYREGEPDLVPPETVNQVMPRWIPPPAAAGQTLQGLLEVVIDENGNVSAATLRRPLHPAYDPLLIKAATTWKYRPARKGGVPVRFMKTISVRLDATK